MTTANILESHPSTRHSDGAQATPRGQVNVSQQERWISAGAGALLTIYGVRKRVRLNSLLFIGAGAMLLRRAISGNCAVYEALGINRADGAGAPPQAYFERGIHVEESFTISKPAEELYTFWRNFENLPKFMRHVKSVQKIDDQRSHWVAEAPLGMSVEWDAEIINDEPNRVIAWRSLGGAEVDNAGSVRFVAAPGDRGTQVKVVMDYIPPAGKAGAVIAKLLGKDPESMVREDLRNFKRLMETGEIPTIQGQPRGTCV
jgi:uncharacterized membrane protein